MTWAAPNDNGSAITGYTVTPYIGSTAQTPVPVNNPSATSATVTGLTNGTTYTFSVAATNSLGASVQSVASAPVTPENAILDFSTPSSADSGDPGSGELGVKFTSDANGLITGIRFYKATANTGTHVGNLWTASGTLLASATFTGESASGWQTVLFSSPVKVNAYTTYVASYFDPNGHYSSSPGGFANSVDNPPLHGVANSTSVNGLYIYSQTSRFPTNTYGANNYSVDVLFAPQTPGQVTGVTATPGHLSATVNWSAPASGGAATYIVTPYTGSTAQTPTVVTGTPAATSTTITGLQQSTAYTFTVQASSAYGTGLVSAPSSPVTPLAPSVPDAPTNVAAIIATGQAIVNWTAPTNNGSPLTSFTVTPYIGAVAQTPITVNDGTASSATVTGLANATAYTFKVSATNGVGTGPTSGASAAVTPDYTIFDFSTPLLTDAGDRGSGELGVKFTSDATGQVLGIRFYKAAANTGTHIGNLWTAAGTLLASATFTNETTSGWQTVLFSNPVKISANTTYVASYFDPNGHYSATPGGLTTSIDNPPLHAVGNSASPNGVYVYSSTSTFPTNTYNAGNYYVDVVFAPQPPAAVSNVSATADHVSATVNWSAPAGGGATSYVVTPYIGSTAQTPVTVTGTPPATLVKITGLTAGTAYTFTVQPANSYGNGPTSGASNSVTVMPPGAPDPPTGVTATPANGQAQVSWTPPTNNNGSAVTGYTVTPYRGTTAGTPVQITDPSTTSTTVTGLTNGTGYTFVVAAANNVGTGTASAASSVVTPEDTIFDFAAPSIIDGGDRLAGELGMKFTSDVNGTVTGIRFYKAAANTGTHIGNLWTAAGTLLASATFTNESTSGWQTVLFSTPVPVTANTTYVASYFDPNGHYSVTPAGLNTSFDSPPLHAVANTTSPNGLYIYSAASTFPTNAYNGNNYAVDVLFQPGS